MNEKQLREAICAHGRLLFGRGFSVGSAGNISARLPDGFLMTPTNSCLGRLDPVRISELDRDYRHVSATSPRRRCSCIAPSSTRDRKRRRWCTSIPLMPRQSPASPHRARPRRSRRSHRTS